MVMFNERNVFMTQSRTNKQWLGAHDMKDRKDIHSPAMGGFSEAGQEDGAER